MDDTPNLNLPLILPQQAQKHVTHNEALRALDCIVQLSVRDRDLSAPPSVPTEGSCYIVAASPTGAWSGHAGQIAAWQDGGWRFYAPAEGWIAWASDEDVLLAWDGAAWIVAGGEEGGGSVNPAPLVGVNATADATNKLSVKSDAVLLSHDDVTPGSGDVRVVVNKSTASKTASFLFQTGFSGRVEIGTIGDNKLHIRTSADGTLWTETLVVDPANGNVAIGSASTGSYPLNISRDVNGTTLVGLTNSNAGALANVGFRVINNVAAYFDFKIRSSAAASNPSTALIDTSASGVPIVFAMGGAEKLKIDSVAVRPGADNTITSGSSSYRWSAVWAANGTIQTSDEREKIVLGELDFAGAMVDTVDPVLFRWIVGGNDLVPSATETEVDDVTGISRPRIDVVVKPGQRTHAGFLAQSLKEAMDAAGVDFGAWGLEDKNDPDSRQWTRSDQLVAVLWAALKETRAEVAALCSHSPTGRDRG